MDIYQALGTKLETLGVELERNCLDGEFYVNNSQYMRRRGLWDFSPEEETIIRSVFPFIHDGKALALTDIWEFEEEPNERYWLASIHFKETDYDGAVLDLLYKDAEISPSTYYGICDN